MFGLSFAKVLLLVLVVAVVWFGFRWLQQLSQAPKRETDLTGRGGVTPRPGDKLSAVEDLTACPRCRAYVPARAPAACGRADCPYPHPT